MKNEKTSKRVATIAGRVQNIIQHFNGDYDFLFIYLGDDTYAPIHLRLKDIGALAGSVLTQAPNRKLFSVGGMKPPKRLWNLAKKKARRA